MSWLPVDKHTYTSTQQLSAWKAGEALKQVHLLG